MPRRKSRINPQDPRLPQAPVEPSEAEVSLRFRPPHAHPLPGSRAWQGDSLDRKYIANVSLRAAEHKRAKKRTVKNDHFTYKDSWPVTCVSEQSTGERVLPLFGPL